MFYGFLRFASKFAFYTLPYKHPIATAIGAKLALLHNEEVIDLLMDESAKQGGDPKDRATVRKDFLNSFGRIYINDKGKLTSIDTQRFNPWASPYMDVLEDPQAALGMISPLLQAVIDPIRGESTFTQQPLNTRGVYSSDRIKPKIGLEEFARVSGRQVSRLAWPIRAADDARSPAPQGDDSIPILQDRPVIPTSASEAERVQRYVDARSTMGKRLKRLVPLTARDDNTPKGVVGAQKAAFERLKKEEKARKIKQSEEYKQLVKKTPSAKGKTYRLSTGEVIKLP
jgi:hypothetical protein